MVKDWSGPLKMFQARENPTLAPLGMKVNIFNPIRASLASTSILIYFFMVSGSKW